MAPGHTVACPGLHRGIKQSSSSHPVSSALPVGYQDHNAAFYACLLSAVKLDAL